MDIQIKNLPNGIGREVVGIDLDGEIPEALSAQLQAEWREAGMLLFRNVAKSPAELVRLSRCFGECEPHPIETFRHPDHQELILLSNLGELKGPVYAYDGVPTYGRIPWHTDLAFGLVPNVGALLRMDKKATIGGRTAWLDTAKAYESFDDAFKKRIEGLEAQFEFCSDLSGMRFSNPGGVRVSKTTSAFPDYPPIARPIVWSHPDTGRTILNVCPLNIRSILGMEQAESDALIEELIERVTEPRFIYRHDWQENDVILWDNYRMMHEAEGHPLDVIRVVHRSTLRGHTTVGRQLAPVEKTAA